MLSLFQNIWHIFATYEAIIFYRVENIESFATGKILHMIKYSTLNDLHGHLTLLYNK